MSLNILKIKLKMEFLSSAHHTYPVADILYNTDLEHSHHLGKTKPGSCSSKCGPWLSSINITWKFLEMEKLHVTSVPIKVWGVLLYSSFQEPCLWRIMEYKSEGWGRIAQWTIQELSAELTTVLPTWSGVAREQTRKQTSNNNK